ncbi:MAG: sigma-70 family RNA polymerase sigma factor [Clostridia bacterium]|nr:sigma-70 family RNA polymerase sigma factor [Clostridia bacterium]
MILEEQNQIAEEARNFLCGYQLCLDMLKLRKYERKRAKAFEEACECADILNGDEAYWKARIYEVATLLGNMKNGREKMVLYYRYVRGESLESAARLMGVSRRTAYRLWHRGLFIAGEYLRKNERISSAFLTQ